MTPWPDARHLAIRVYYEDTDFSGVVYHANYLRFLERGRTEFLRELGIRQSDLHGGDGEGTGGAFAVRHMTLSFHAPAGMDDMIVVETRAASVGGASVTMEQRILRADDILLDASVRIAFVVGGRARRLPKALAARLGTAPAGVT